MHRDHLVGNWYFVPFFVLYTKSVMLGPRFIPESVFYTQSVMLSPCFIPESMFYTDRKPVIEILRKRMVVRNIEYG